MSAERALALAALRRYDLVPLRVRLAARSYNSIFRVSTATAVYALRVGAAQPIHPDGTAAVEAAWHRRLRQHGVEVPDVHANADGEFATRVSGDGPRLCLLFGWVAGRSLRTVLTERRSAALGRLSARLHQDATGWTPPQAADLPRADRVLYWPLPGQLAVAGSRFGFGSLFTDALARAEPVVESLWRSPPHPPHLVHGDLTPPNVIVAKGGGLVPIDFQDGVWGFAVQDLAITVASFRRWPNADRLADAFQAGYSESGTWPDVSPALFGSLIAARALHQLNFTLAIGGLAGRESYVAGHAERTRAWLRHPPV